MVARSAGAASADLAVSAGRAAVLVRGLCGSAEWGGSGVASYGEGGRADGRLGFDDDLGDLSSSGAAPGASFQGLEVFGVAFSEDLDASVGEVADPAAQAEFLGDLLGPVPVTDALDGAADEEPLRDPLLHARSIAGLRPAC